MICKKIQFILLFYITSTYTWGVNIIKEEDPIQTHLRSCSRISNFNLKSTTAKKSTSVIFFPNKTLWFELDNLPIVNPKSFGGGLQLIKSGGNQQSQTKKYRFKKSKLKIKVRFLHKRIPEKLVGSIPYLSSLVQEQHFSFNPLAGEISRKISNLVHLPHNSPYLILFREKTDLIGTIEYDLNDSVLNGFSESLSTANFLKKVPLEKIDIQLYLRHRLINALLGDWDRHQNQWVWALSTTEKIWQPINVDHDCVFFSLEGTPLNFIIEQSRLFQNIRRTQNPYENIQFICSFKKRYPHPKWLMGMSNFLDLRLLSGTKWENWKKEILFIKQNIKISELNSIFRSLPITKKSEKFITKFKKNLESRLETLDSFSKVYYKWLISGGHKGL